MRKCCGFKAVLLLIALCVVISAPPAQATAVVQYDVQGHYTYRSGGEFGVTSFSGTGELSVTGGDLRPLTDDFDPHDGTNFSDLFIGFDLFLMDENNVHSTGSLWYNMLFVSGDKKQAHAFDTWAEAFDTEFNTETSMHFPLFAPFVFPDSFSESFVSTVSRAGEDPILLGIEMDFTRIVPVPEPSTLPLMCLFLSILVIARKRTNRDRAPGEALSAVDRCN